jgi:hypothetical protein
MPKDVRREGADAASLAQAGEELGEAVDVERLAGASGEERRLRVRGDA